MPAPHSTLAQTLPLLRDHRMFLPNPTFANPAWDAAALSVLILRLSPYADVERSTPHLFLAREVRGALPDAYIDMAFLPGDRDARILADAGLPLVIGTQSHRFFGDFDLVLASNSWLLEQVNLPWLLLNSGVPLMASRRGPEWPPLILGGSNASAAHALVTPSGDSFADALFFGEGEASVGRIARLFAETTGTGKRERIERIAAAVPGFWPAGDLTRPAIKARAPREADLPTWSAMPLLPGPEAGTARLAITRGCPCLCTFCFEAFDRAPFRQIPGADILRTARELKHATGAEALEIESFNFNTHTELPALLLGLHRLFHRVNMMSQRVDILAQTPGLLDLEIAADKHGFTLGIEGISEGLRRFLHKSLGETDVHRVMEALHARKTREIKLFYLLTGRERGADFEEFAGFLKWLQSLRERSEAKPRVVFSFGLLVRMPFTPLRHDAPILDEQEWRGVAGRAKSLCETHGFEYRLALSWPEYSATQALASGDHELAELLVSLAREGSIEERGLTLAARDVVKEWISRHGDSLAGEKPLDHPFGFPFLNDAKTRAFLHGRYRAAADGRDAGYCRRGAAGTEACDDCPGCTRVPARRTIAPAGLGEETRRMTDLMARKRRLPPLLVRARVPREAAGMGARWVEALLMRLFLRIHPAQDGNLLSVREVMVEASGVLGEESPWWGEAVVSLIAWDADTLRQRIAAEDGPFGAVHGMQEPGSFKTMRVRVELPLEHFPDPANRLARFLSDSHAPVVLSRGGEGARFTVPQKSIKKHLLIEGRCADTEAATIFDLTIGSHAFLGAWLESFSGPSGARRASIEVLAID